MEPLTDDERHACAELLQRIAETPSLIDHDERLKGLIARIHRDGRRGARRADHESVRESDKAIRRTAALARRDAGVTPPALESLSASASPEHATPKFGRPALCYICKSRFRDVHFFYHSLCPACAIRNFDKRSQRADLTGRTALITGARIKIGFELALKLLRDGATVIATTRFPRDAARRFASQPDLSDWSPRLRLFGLDLRDLAAAEAFARQIDDIDIVIHNAAQTIRRPAAYYAALIGAEAGPLPQIAAGWIETNAPSLSNRALTSIEPADTLSAWFPDGALDRDGEPLDARPTNSWRLALGEIEPIEMVETMLIGAMAPFVLTSALRPTLARSTFARRFVVMVSAMEGQFARPSKQHFHPHTNMAKAAMNMLTRTSAADLARDCIFLNAVDTGWITDENPLPMRERTRLRHDFIPPLDGIDGAARIYDPIVRGLSEPDAAYGLFWKDYEPFPW